MKITNVRVHKVSGEGKLRAYCSVVFDGMLAVNDLKVVEGVNGLFVSMPSRKIQDGKYRDVIYPCTAEARQAIQSAVLGAYLAIDGAAIEAPEQPAEPEPAVEPGLEGVDERPLPPIDHPALVPAGHPAFPPMGETDLAHADEPDSAEMDQPALAGLVGQGRQSA